MQSIGKGMKGSQYDVAPLSFREDENHNNCMVVPQLSTLASVLTHINTLHFESASMRAMTLSGGSALKWTSVSRTLTGDQGNCYFTGTIHRAREGKAHILSPYASCP